VKLDIETKAEKVDLSVWDFMLYMCLVLGEVEGCIRLAFINYIAGNM
jgi:hypothetical protein